MPEKYHRSVPGEKAEKGPLGAGVGDDNSSACPLIFLLQNVKGEDRFFLYNLYTLWYFSTAFLVPKTRKARFS